MLTLTQHGKHHFSGMKRQLPLGDDADHPYNGTVMGQAQAARARFRHSFAGLATKMLKPLSKTYSSKATFRELTEFGKEKCEIGCFEITLDNTELVNPKQSLWFSTMKHANKVRHDNAAKLNETHTYLLKAKEDIRKCVCSFVHSKALSDFVNTTGVELLEEAAEIMQDEAVMTEAAKFERLRYENRKVVQECLNLFPETLAGQVGVACNLLDSTSRVLSEQLSRQLHPYLDERVAEIKLARERFSTIAEDFEMQLLNLKDALAKAAAFGGMRAMFGDGNEEDIDRVVLHTDKMNAEIAKIDE